MQIIPTNNTNLSFGFFSSIGEEAGSSFMDAMSNAFDAVKDGSYNSVSSAMDDVKSQPLVESPYTRHTSNGVTYTLSEVCFTKQELVELREQLIKEGAPVECLKQFDVLAGQPDGATLAQVMASLMATQPNQFSEDDAQAITSILTEIDPSGQLATDALDLMRKGNGADALELIQKSLESLGADTRINIDPDSLLALGRGLGLNNDSLRNLVGGLNGQTVTVNAAMFDTLMQPAKSQFLTEAANAEKLNAALEKTLKPIISKARERMEKEEAAAALSNRRVEQSKILINETVQKNSREMIDKTVTGEAAQEREAEGSDLEALRHQARQSENTPTESAKHQNTPTENVQKQNPRNESAQNLNAQNSKNARNEQGLLMGHGEQNKEPAGENNSGQSHQEKPSDEGWQNLLGRITTKPVETNKSAPRNDSIVYSMLQGNYVQQASFGENVIQEPLAPLATQLASQVEQGMLTAMRDGATRLDLQLHPADLGSIAITLIARNGEITAQIRSEKSETAEMVSKQLDTIRVNLEQQGLKVDKIEVQLENKGENANGFDNLDQHNARQEESAFRQDLQRLRNLANVRKLDGQEEVLAQNMHNMRQTAIYAAQGLHVVA